MVIFLSRSLGRVLVAITAGTVQPKPISIGTILLPESPIFLNSLSIKNATRAIYPESSIRDRKKNNVTITGKKLRTLPTHGTVRQKGNTVNGLRQQVLQKCPYNIKCKVKYRQHYKYKTRYSGIFACEYAVDFSLLMRSLLSFGFTTVASQTLSINVKRISAIAALRSSPLSFSI